MGSTSALTIIRKLNEEIPYSVKKGEEFLDTLTFLNRELSFAQFAIAKATLSGELPKEQYFASRNFPVFDPRALDQAIRSQQSLVEPMNQVLMVPCLHEGQLVGVLFAHHLSGAWIQSESILIEVAATELGRLLAPVQPGLTTNQNLRVKSKKFSQYCSRDYWNARQVKTNPLYY